MNDTASVTSSSLVVAEKPSHRNGGCVGIFFQLFDWNRRFTKKKLFSKRLLPSDHAKEASKKFGGDEKLPKLRLIADENCGGFPNKNKNGVNGAQTPTLVARLMGLETMPPVHCEDLQKEDSGEFGRREKVVGEIGSQEFRPQKLQKTAMADRRTVTRFGAEAFQLKNVLSQSRKHHHHAKLPSPVKNSNHHGKRNSSRLIGAATRILEPQGRNKSRCAISYGHRARNPPGNGLRHDPIRAREDLDLSRGQQSCKNCGNLLDVVEFSSKIDQEQAFVGPNTGLNNGRIRARVRAKGEDMKVDNKMNKFESGRVDRSKRQALRARKQTGPDAWRPEFEDAIGSKKSNDEMRFRFGSPVNERFVRVERGKKKPNVSPRKRFTSDEKIWMHKAFVGSGINGNPQKRTSNKWETIPFDGFCLQEGKSEKVRGLTGVKNNDHLSPGSVLEASFSIDSCCSSSLDDCSVRTQHGDLMNYLYDDEPRFQEIDAFRLTKENAPNELVADLLTYISQVLCTMDLVDSRTNRRNIKEIIFNSELVLGHQMQHNPNEINPFFICDLLLELDTLAGVMWTTFGSFLGSHNPNARFQLKRFVFDSLIEYLELKYVKYSKCGFTAWMNLPRFMGFDHLVRDVVEEVRRWTGVASGELVVEMDTSHCSRTWTDFEMEVYEMGAKVEWDIVQSLIDEIVVDVANGMGLLGV